MRRVLLAFSALAMVGLLVADLNACGHWFRRGHRRGCCAPTCNPCPDQTPKQTDDSDPDLEEVAELPQMADKPRPADLPDVKYFTDQKP
jgi:hypothetical protein